MHGLTPFLPIVVLVLSIINTWVIFYFGRPPEGREAFLAFLKRGLSRTKRFVRNCLPYVTAAYMVVIIITIELPLTRYGLAVIVAGTFATALNFSLLMLYKNRLRAKTAHFESLISIEFLVGNMTALFPELLTALMRSKALTPDEAEAFLAKMNTVSERYNERHENFEELIEKETF